MTRISNDLLGKLREHREMKSTRAAETQKKPIPPKLRATPAKKIAVPSGVVSPLRRRLIASGKVAPYQTGGTRAQWMAHLREIRTAKRLQAKK